MKTRPAKRGGNAIELRHRAVYDLPVAAMLRHYWRMEYPMLRGLWFAGGMIFGILLTCVACSQTPGYSGVGYYGPPPTPPPGSHPAITQALNELQHTRYVLTNESANDYQGHKRNAIGFVDNAVHELQICISMP
jgi:hypothetical protein